jgi:hypothetical protein
MTWGPGRSRMRPPGIKRQTTPEERTLAFFRRVGLGVVGIRLRALTAFPSSGTDGPCLHQTRLEVLSPWRWRVQRRTRLCALETSRYPPPVLRHREAARLPCASALQARERGRPRHPEATIAVCRGAGAGVQSTAEGSGVRASVLLGVHGRCVIRMAEHAAQAHPVHVQVGVRLPRSAHSPWSNVGISQAWWRLTRAETVRPSCWARSGNAVPWPCWCSNLVRDLWPAGWARRKSPAAAAWAPVRAAWPLLAPAVP